MFYHTKITTEIILTMANINFTFFDPCHEVSKMYSQYSKVWCP